VKEFSETNMNGKVAVCSSSGHVSCLERAVDELMTGVLIRFDTLLDPVTKSSSGGRTGVKPTELRVKTTGSGKPSESV